MKKMMDSYCRTAMPSKSTVASIMLEMPIMLAVAAALGILHGCASLMSLFSAVSWFEGHSHELPLLFLLAVNSPLWLVVATLRQLKHFPTVALFVLLATSCATALLGSVWMGGGVEIAPILAPFVLWFPLVLVWMVLPVKLMPDDFDGGSTPG